MSIDSIPSLSSNSFSKELVPNERTDMRCGTIVVDNKITDNIIDFGTICITPQPSIENVMLVEKLPHNLLSVSQLCDNGYDILFGLTNCVIFYRSNDSTLLIGNMTDHVYSFDS